METMSAIVSIGFTLGLTAVSEFGSRADRGVVDSSGQRRSSGHSGARALGLVQNWAEERVWVRTRTTRSGGHVEWAP